MGRGKGLAFLGEEAPPGARARLVWREPLYQADCRSGELPHRKMCELGGHMRDSTAPCRKPWLAAVLWRGAGCGRRPLNHLPSDTPEPLGRGRRAAPAILASLFLYPFVTRNKYSPPSAMTTQPGWGVGITVTMATARSLCQQGVGGHRTCALWFPFSLGDLRPKLHPPHPSPGSGLSEV